MAGTAQTGEHGHCLPHADYECIKPCDIAATTTLLATGVERMSRAYVAALRQLAACARKICKREQCRGNTQTDAHNHQIAASVGTDAEESLDSLFETHSDNSDRYTGKEDFPNIRSILIASECEERSAQWHKLTP